MTPPDPYDSHLPVLKALLSLIPMRNVLEFGSGAFSTPFFLGLSDLKKLVSVETDPRWYIRVETEHKGDKRFQIAKKRPQNLEGFDFVFVDDGENPAQRVETINWILGQDHPPVVIHDAEVPEYREAIEASDSNHVTFQWATPWTELVWR